MEEMVNPFLDHMLPIEIPNPKVPSHVGLIHACIQAIPGRADAL